MAWIKLDDGFALHPKFARAVARDPMAIVLWLAGAAHCARNGTDGLLVREEAENLPRFSERLAGILVEVGFWDVEGRDWRYHGWLEYQISRAEAEKLRADEREKKQRQRAKVSPSLSPALSPPLSLGGPLETSGSGSYSSGGRESVREREGAEAAAPPVLTVPVALPERLPVAPRDAVAILAEHGAPRLKLVRNRATDTGLPEPLERHLAGILAEYRPDASWLERAGCLIASGDLWGHLKAGISGQALLGKAGGPGTLAEVLELTREDEEQAPPKAPEPRRAPLTPAEEAERKAMLKSFWDKQAEGGRG